MKEGIEEINKKEHYLDNPNTDLVATYNRIKEKYEGIDQDMRNLTNKASFGNNNKSIQDDTESINKSMSDLLKEINQLIKLGV